MLRFICRMVLCVACDSRPRLEQSICVMCDGKVLHDEKLVTVFMQ